MGILDDAIKEHLELKRQHGAEQSELEQLEDEAFGAAERPGTEGSVSDPLAEAPTEFMERPDLGAAQEAETAAPGASSASQADASAPETGEAAGRRRTEIADLQESPEPKPSVEPEQQPEPEEPAEEQAPAMEHEAISETATPPEPEPQSEQPAPSTGHSTEERHAIAEQPTEMFDVEEELAGSEAKAPSEEELVEEEITGPRLAPADPLSGLHDSDEEDDASAVEEPADASLDEEFWDEKRLSDELDQALEAPIELEPEGESEPAVEEGKNAPEATEEPEAEVSELATEASESGVDDEQHAPAPARDDDVLEETPDFLEETPEDDRLWFEQKPPKDFDFDD